MAMQWGTAQTISYDNIKESRKPAVSIEIDSHDLREGFERTGLADPEFANEQGGSPVTRGARITE